MSDTWTFDAPDRYKVLAALIEARQEVSSQYGLDVPEYGFLIDILGRVRDFDEGHATGEELAEDIFTRIAHIFVTDEPASAEKTIDDEPVLFDPTVHDPSGAFAPLDLPTVESK